MSSCSQLTPAELVECFVLDKLKIAERWPPRRRSAEIFGCTVLHDHSTSTSTLALPWEDVSHDGLVSPPSLQDGFKVLRQGLPERS